MTSRTPLRLPAEAMRRIRPRSQPTDQMETWREDLRAGARHPCRTGLPTIDRSRPRPAQRAKECWPRVGGLPATPGHHRRDPVFRWQPPAHRVGAVPIEPAPSSSKARALPLPWPRRRRVAAVLVRAAKGAAAAPANQKVLSSVGRNQGLGEFSRRSGAPSRRHLESIRRLAMRSCWRPPRLAGVRHTRRLPAMPTTPHSKPEDVLRRISAAYNDGRIVSGLKRRVKDALRSTANRFEHHPQLRRMALWCLRLAPPLHKRLSAMLGSSPRPAATRLRGPADLSPAAQNVFQRLTRQHSTKELDANRH